MMNPSGLTVTAPTDREIVMTRVFSAPRKLVFDAWTKPELVKRWLLGPPGWTMPVCEIDLRVGGKYRFEWRGQDGTVMGMGGVYREIVIPERIINTQLFDEDWTGGETLARSFLSSAMAKPRSRTKFSIPRAKLATARSKPTWRRASKPDTPGSTKFSGRWTDARSGVLVAQASACVVLRSSSFQFKITQA